MPESVAMRTAARELGLRPKVLELAVQTGEIRTVRGAVPGTRRVSGQELRRLKDDAGFPRSLEERLCVVDAGKGARLLGVSVSRFARLARGGCFSPVRFYVNRYRTVVWLYLVRDLREFAERRPELLTGPLPRGLRVLLEEGVDFRPRHWRGRRVGQLCRQAGGPWELAAARAAVLGADVLEEAVPNARERARLAALQPELMVVRSASAATREAAEALCVATEEDEILWHRLMLEADLEDARASQQPDPGVPSHPQDSGPVPASVTPPRRPAAVPCPANGGGSVRADTRHGGRAGRERRHLSAEGPSSDVRRAQVLSGLRGPRRRPGWWRRGRDLNTPAV